MDKFENKLISGNQTSLTQRLAYKLMEYLSTNPRLIFQNPKISKYLQFTPTKMSEPLGRSLKNNIHVPHKNKLSSKFK